MSENFDLQSYMTKGVERIVAETVRAGLKNPREASFMMRFAAAAKSAAKRREAAEAKGLIVPAFLTAAVTEKTAESSKMAGVETAPLGAEEWLGVFDAADRLGVSFILLTGGEPLLRRDVLKCAVRKPNILFPVIADSMLPDERHLSLFDRSRNLVPVLSFAGGRIRTDARYGEGAFEKRMAAFAQYREMGLSFGASVLVTKENAEEAADPAFVKKLADCGCRMLFFREEASFTAEDREAFTARINAVRSAAAKPLIISFPQDMLDAYGLTEQDQDRFSVDVHGRCILLQK